MIKREPAAVDLVLYIGEEIKRKGENVTCDVGLDGEVCMLNMLQMETILAESGLQDNLSAKELMNRLLDVGIIALEASPVNPNSLYPTYLGVKLTTAGWDMYEEARNRLPNP